MPRSPVTRNDLAVRPGRNGAVSRKELNAMLTEIGFSEVQSAYTESVDQFKSRWLFDASSEQEIMKRCRLLVEGDRSNKPHPFLQWLTATRISFFNADFRLTSKTEQKRTEAWLDERADYPFDRLARDVWREYETTSNVVAFWRDKEKAPDGSLINGLPRITVLDAERVEYKNEFGVEKVSFTPVARTLSQAEADGLGPRYAKATREGKPILLDPTKGERFKVLSTAKMGYGLGMPKIRAAFDDLAILELLRVGDWNGAWARKKIIRQTRKGHEITAGQLQGQPLYFFRSDFGKKVTKLLNTQTGFMEMATNFDQVMEYIFLNAEFFDAKIYEAVEERIDRWAGPLALMLRTDSDKMPYLMPLFRAEGLAERDIVGKYIESIVNDPSFLGIEVGGGRRNSPATHPAPPQRLKVQWDDTVFFNEKMLMTWLQFAYANGLMSPQTARRCLRLNDGAEIELLQEAHKNADDYRPVFEPKQGLLTGEGDGGNAGELGGRPPKKDGGS